MSYTDYNDNNHNNGYNFDLINGHLNDSSSSSFSMKRNSDGSEMDNKKSNKKRFVWPDDLHREFIAAVFDVGLNHASVESLHDSLPKQHHIGILQIKGILARLKIFRDKRDMHSSSSNPSSPRNWGQASMTNLECLHDSVTHAAEIPLDSENLPLESPFQRTNSDDLENENSELAKMQIATHRIRTELRSVRDTIDAHNEYITNLRTSLNTQMRLYNQLVGTLAQLDPVAVNELQPLSTPDFSGAEMTRLVTGQQPRRYSMSDLHEPHDSHTDVRQELQAMSSEMRSHMSMHRQLMMRREGQLLLHSGGNTARSSNNGSVDVRQSGRLQTDSGQDHAVENQQTHASADEEAEEPVTASNGHSRAAEMGQFQSFDIDDELFSFLLEPGSGSSTNW